MKAKKLVAFLLAWLLMFSCASALTQSQHDELDAIASNFNLLKSSFDPGDNFEEPQFIYLRDEAQFFMVFPFVGFSAASLREMLDYSQELYNAMLRVCTSGYDALQPIISKVSDEVSIIVTIFGNDGNMVLTTMDGEDVTELLQLVM